MVVAFALCAAAAEQGGCRLLDPSSAAAPSAVCLACHVQQDGATNHVVGVPYVPGRALDLRPSEEVARRGIRLPGGEVGCTTCHDAMSPWKNHVALPPGSRAVRAIDLRDRGSWEGPPQPARPGDAVAVKPLCLACHAMD